MYRVIIVAMKIGQALSKRLHTSWLIAFVCIGFLSGVGVSLFLRSSVFATVVWWPVVAIVLIILVFISRLRVMVIFALAAGLILGLGRGTWTRVDLNIFSDWIGQEVVLKGVVEEDPDIGASHDLRIKIVNSEVILSDDYDKLSGEVENFNDYFTSLPGQIWVSAMARGAVVKRSDVVEISGKLKSGFGTFPASMSFANLVVVTSVPGADPMRDIRDAFGDKLRTVIEAPAADLGMGILAGQKTALPADLSAAFIVASLTHIVVASGYNLTILIRFARRLFAKISRFAALSFGGLLVFAFACTTGFSPSMTRAALVAGFSLLAWYYGRRFHPIVLLSLVASITVAMEPNVIWGDAGWYLSFLSFVGVIILAPLIKDYFWGRDKKLTVPLITRFWSKFRRRYFSKKNFIAPTPREPSFNLRQIFIETTSAQIMAAPIIALFMGQFSPYGLIANLVVLPILPLVMLLTFIAGIASFALPMFLAQIIAAPAQWLLDYIINVARWVSDLPGASQEIIISPWVSAGVFAVIVAVIFYLKHFTCHNFREDNVVE
ncbi:MAG: ComEC/Rec2 family competence protein [Candidatus Nomurabacteria bacterium]|jgi:competence protein ComEC|nr:ComEC/Rec2 family competence protein [Candidatus Nomurabacteria bacterium]